MIARFLGVAAIASLALSAALAMPRLGARTIALEASPARIDFDRRYGAIQLVLTGRLDDGTEIDFTRDAELAAPSPLVDVSSRGVVRPLRDGEGELRFSVDGLELALPVHVANQGLPFEASFVQDVMPILSSAGCTAGGCHGAADGKNGFKLSLRGYDAAADHAALTDDLAGRRFDRVRPAESLFLLKPTATVPHEGGRRFERGSDAYEVLRAWVESGAPFDAERPRARSIELVPRDPTLALPGDAQQLRVLARYPDGAERDVTREAFLESSDPDVARVEEGALVTGLRRGEAAVLARYEGCYAAASVLVMGDRSGFAWRAAPQHNFIDELVDAKLQRIRALPSELCTDDEFLRRVTLDLTGLPPTPKEVRTFLADERASRTKREELIDRLIGGAAFVDHWTNKWCDLLQVNPRRLGDEGARRLRGWIRGRVASNEPFDRFAAAVLGSSGSTTANPPAAYYKILREPDLAMENTTQLFLGVRFNCNKCHDHPFERWTRAQHWGLAAFLGQVGRRDAEGSPKMPRTADDLDAEPPAYEEIIEDLREGEVKDPETNAVVAPAFPFEHAGAVPADAPRRERLVRWVVAPENPYFATSAVNRIWSSFFGTGLIEPVDDIRAGNPPTNPALLERLTADFIAGGFDLRRLMRTICRSRAYQSSIRANEWNADDETSYSHAKARRLPAEVLYDALRQATGSSAALPGQRRGTLAAELFDPAVDTGDGFLGLFGRPPRRSACECERGSGMSLGQALSLVNGETLSAAVRDPRNDIADLAAVEREPVRIVEELYLAFLARLPSVEESNALVPSFDATTLANRAALAPSDSEELDRRIAAWEASIPRALWTSARTISARSTGGAEFERLEDGSLRAGGPRPEKDSYTLVVWSEFASITGLRIEALSDPALPGSGPGRADNGNFVLNELHAVAVPLGDPELGRDLALREATADFSQDGFAVGGAIDGKPDTGWAVVPRVGMSHQAVFETAEDAGGAGGTLFVLTLDMNFGGSHTLGGFRISLTDSPRPVRHSGLPDDVLEALATPPAERTPEQTARAFAAYIATDPEMSARLRLSAAQDLAWALATSPSFLFNR